MRVAALILAHHKPNSLAGLIRECLDQQMDVFIHLDANSEISVSTLSSLGSHVFILTHRHKIQWGGISIVRATHDLFSKAFEGCYDYYVLLSGEDIFIHKNVKQFLLDLQGNSMFGYWSMPYEKWWGGGMFRVERPHFFNKKTQRALSERLYNYFHFFLNRHSPKTQFKKHFPTFDFFGGQQWMVLSREAVRFYLQFVDSNTQIWDVFKYAFAPDEMFIQTVLLNQKDMKIVNRSTHYVRFSENASSPDYLTESEISQLRLSGQYLFARKYAR